MGDEEAENQMIQVIKRDNRVVNFDKTRIVNAIIKSMESEGVIDEELALAIAEKIESENIDRIDIEQIENKVIKELYLANLDNVALSYAEYKTTRKLERLRKVNNNNIFITDEFLSAYKHKEEPFPSELGKFVYYRTYSRPIPAEQRREYWWETIARVVEFNFSLELDAMKRQGIIINHIVLHKLQLEAKSVYDLMFHLKLFPSGRSLWIGGSPSSYLYSLSNFNCSFLALDSFVKFSEMFFVLMLGTGVGVSVEKQYICKLPKVNSHIEIVHKSYVGVPKTERKEYTELRTINKNAIEIEIGDSKFGWSKAIEIYFDIISSKQYSGIDYIFFNYNNIRPKGERLKTFGGTASGHNNIRTMFTKIDNIIKHKKAENGIVWQALKPIDCLDISTIIAENVVSGGVRRSAEIMFCDKDETDVLEAKSGIYYQNDKGEWITNNEIMHRTLSNNTILHKTKPSREELNSQMKAMRYSGEPAFGNFEQMKKRREDVQGGNPCFEILLRDRGVCNLTEVNLMGFVNSDGSYDEQGLLEAQRMSARIGYRMASVELELNEWNLVNIEDRLVGCSLTGVMDFRNATNISRDDFNALLARLREIANISANEMADYLSMNRSKLVTCVKPSGSISLLPTVSSGVHFSHSPYFIRRVRVNSQDPISQAMVASGFKWFPEVGQSVEEHSTKVFEFPVCAPKGKTKYDISAIEQLELYKDLMEYYVDHNASNTIHVRDNEWEAVEEWIWNNWEHIVGVTFLSLDDSFYQLLPYESITKEQYEQMLENQPKFNPNTLKQFENFEEEFEITDSECAGGACPVR